MNPTGPFPIAIRASLISVIMDATTGAEADVPKTRLSDPSTPISESAFVSHSKVEVKNLPIT